MSDGMTTAPESAEDMHLPPMPAVPASELYRGSSRMIRYDVRHSVGWEHHRTAGRGFVVARLPQLGGTKVLARFPLTPEGWAGAWQALAELDPAAATAIGSTLAAGAERRRLAEQRGKWVRLDSMRYDGGSGSGTLFRGQAYDLRFLDDRLTIARPATNAAVTELAYGDVEALEVDGADRGRSGGEMIAVISAAALGGALVGFFILGLLGLILGALLLGLLAGVAMALAYPAKAILRLRGPDTEIFFSKAGRDPGTLRIALSEPLLAIDRARAAVPPLAPAGPPEPGPTADAAPPSEGTVADQLTKLAALLADGLLSREEFEQLKARVIARS